jgi:hypothetical protein
MIYPKLRQNFSGKIATSISIIAFFSLGLVVMGILNVYIPKQTQTIESDAATMSPIQEAKCINTGGECQTGKSDQIGKPCALTDSTLGTVVYNYCPTQEGDVRCCVPNGAVDPVEDVAEYSTNLVITLQGIGPDQSITKNTRTASIKIFKNSGTFERADYAVVDILTYDPVSGNFVNDSFSLGELPAGEYQMVIQVATYLDEQLLNTSGSGIFSMSAGAGIDVAPITLKAGDLGPGDRGDNSINIIDYNALLGCMPEAPPGACLNRDYADLNDDGVVDQNDMDILMENFEDDGFAFKTDKFECKQDPKCETGRDTLQLCSLKCTIKSKRS